MWMSALRGDHVGEIIFSGSEKCGATSSPCKSLWYNLILIYSFHYIRDQVSLHAKKAGGSPRHDPLRHTKSEFPWR